HQLLPQGQTPTRWITHELPTHPRRRRSRIPHQRRGNGSRDHPAGQRHRRPGRGADEDRRNRWRLRRRRTRRPLPRAHPAAVGKHRHKRPRRGARHPQEGSGSHAEEATMTSEQINELVGALAKAQGEMDNAPMLSENPHFRSKYADLASIRNATVPHLAKNGLALFQSISAVNGSGLLLVTRLAHSSGQWVESAYPIPLDSKPHIMGSAITY